MSSSGTDPKREPLSGTRQEILRSSRLHALTGHDVGDEENDVSLDGGIDKEPPDAALTTRLYLRVALAAVVWASTTYVSSSALFFFDPVTVHFASATSTAVVLYSFYAFSGLGVTAAVSQSVALQLLGILLAKVALSHPSQSHLAPSLILLTLAFTSACNVLIIDNTYHSHVATLGVSLNTVLFSSGLALHLVIGAFQAFFISSSPAAFIPDWSLRRVFSLIIRALLDWSILSIIHDYDAILERVLYSLSLGLLILIISLLNKSSSLSLLVGSVVALWSSISYLSKALYKGHDTSELESPVSTRRRRFIAWAIFIVLGLCSVVGAIEAVLLRSERSLPAPDILSFPGRAVCQRRPLPVLPLQPTDRREYNHFDDILLIVFFSHARYDTNLDSYREVYAEYFPNILFIGPASREDAGFDHSYDVLVDTYQAAEDLKDPTEYKMGGRMAHHMLYTALQEHPCYNGYLWAPFDTLLNVPRLQLFDQDKFWYHSPFGRYVPNPAFDPSAIGNASFHAPPAKISPNPANMTTPWKGWGEDWWWGSPHVGLLVCMQAFNKVPKEQRDRLAALTGEPNRFIGGSADTMYVPGRHRETFMSTLALFLQTNCFLEIAAPTTLHLVLPPHEEILYVDHWWIWQPPFDTRFVRGQWAQGREVDTFHSFHWGELSGQGDAATWEPRPERVGDMRRLLQDSAARQGIPFPKTSSLKLNS
ncbi:hypothetical protein F5148DRAFT_898836 [Russula earlei]|uniref:Uncharacterized protein n=1 Tax=Russula earlei TaxID=71964 RepID=A0ACC0ULD1_9AGAM|nr:hypothetical protein F5148DRAFT_898836 [Russula earlei]